jgi:cystathionine beta-lyase/cystathionine gamma-synthase
MNDNTSGYRSPAAQQRHADTRLVTAGRDPKSQHGFVNPPVYRLDRALPDG